MTGELSNDIVAIACKFFKDNYVAGGGETTPSFRTSPPEDVTSKNPQVYMREIQTLEELKNVHGTRFRQNAEIWAHIEATSKAIKTYIFNNMRTVLRAKWKIPGVSNVWYIKYIGRTPNDDLEAIPKKYGIIMRMQFVWDETT